MIAWNLLWILPLAWVVIGGSIAQIILQATSRPTPPALSPEDMQRLYTEYMQPTVSRSPFRKQEEQP